MRLGSRGLREVGGRIEAIGDAGLRRALRRRALVIAAQSVLVAAVVTAALWMAP